MGVPDTVTYEYMKRNEVFADAFNFLLYNGEKIIDHSELKELDAKTIAYIFNESKGKKADRAIQKFRDIFKQAIIKQDNKATYVLLGIENQSDIHYAMPIRNMVYDALSYSEQVSAIEHHNRDNKLTGKQFLSGFLKSDKLLPVITLVVYFGPKKWDGPLTLHEMLDTKDDVVLKYTQNYRINLIEPSALDEEELKMFTSDLGRVLQIIKYSEDSARFKEYVLEKEELILSKEAGNVIENVTSIKIPDKLKDGKKEIDMCLALREIIEEENNKIIKQMEEENIKVIKQMEEEKADIIKDSERKIAESVLINNIKLVEKGKLLATDAAEASGLSLKEFLKKKEEYESSTLA